MTEIRNPLTSPKQRLERLSMDELTGVYDALSLACNCLLGIVNQPRFYTKDDLNGGGAEVDFFVDALNDYIGEVVAVAGKASPSDPGEASARAWLLLRASASYKESLSDFAAEAAGAAAQVATLKKLKHGS
jgi:hypothetical protein